MSEVKIHLGSIIPVVCEHCCEHADGSAGYVVAGGGASWSEYKARTVISFFCKGMLCPECTVEWARMVKEFWGITEKEEENDE